MFSMLPDLLPRDSHMLWYTSTHSPLPLNATDPAAFDPSQPPSNLRRQNQAAFERTPLARLRADELYQERRKQNISNFGSTWLKPPGISKSLFQMREERREAEEHAEALRREQLAQQLAEAEAGGGDEDELVNAMEVDMDGELVDGDEDGMGMMDDGGERDLDDDIPEAEAGFGYDGENSDEDDDEDEVGGGGDDHDDDGDDHDDDDDIESVDILPRGATAVERGERREVQTIRHAEDRLQEMLARGGGTTLGGAGVDLSGFYGPDDEPDEEEQAQILEEDDLVPAGGDSSGAGMQRTMPDDSQEGDDGQGMMDMDADLDEDIPEAEGMGYEHTDSDAELSSEGYGGEHSFADGGGQGSSSRAAGRQHDRHRTSMAHSDANSLDISGLLSAGSSSVLGSSPNMRRLP